MINLADITIDPDFAITIDVTRRRQSVNDYGETIVESEKHCIKGTLTVASSRDLERIPEASQSTGMMKVTTTSYLYDERGDRQADILTAMGHDFTVVSVIDYSQYGFVQAICTTRDVSRER